MKTYISFFPSTAVENRSVRYVFYTFLAIELSILRFIMKQELHNLFKYSLNSYVSTRTDFHQSLGKMFL